MSSMIFEHTSQGAIRIHGSTANCKRILAVLTAAVPELPSNRITSNLPAEGEGMIEFPVVKAQASALVSFLESWANTRAGEGFDIQRGRNRTVIQGLKD